MDAFSAGKGLGASGLQGAKQRWRRVVGPGSAGLEGQVEEGSASLGPEKL